MIYTPDAPAPTLTELIERQQDGLELADKAVADALGYSNLAVIRLIKAGQMKLPMKKASALAQVLEVEPGVVMYLLLSETAPKVLSSIEDCMGPLALSLGEKRLLAELRK